MDISRGLNEIEINIIEKALLEYAINHFENVLVVSNLIVKIEEQMLPFN